MAGVCGRYHTILKTHPRTFQARLRARPKCPKGRSGCKDRGWAQPPTPPTQPLSRAARNHFTTFKVHCIQQDKRQRRNLVCLNNVVIYLLSGLITMLSALLIYLAFDLVDSF